MTVSPLSLMSSLMIKAAKVTAKAAITTELKAYATVFMPLEILILT